MKKRGTTKARIKRILSMALVFFLCLTMLPTVAIEADAADSVSMLVSYAQNRVGKTGQELGYTDQWCAFFVCDCAAYAGQTKVIPRHGNAHNLYFLVIEAGGNVVSDPRKGDLVFYNCTACDTNGDGISMMHVGLVENENYTIEGNLDGSSYLTRTVKRKGINERYSHDSSHSTDNYVKRVFVRPNYSGLSPHTCDKGTYVYYEAAHPHYKCYKCSICGSVWRNTTEPTKVSSCTTCVPTRTVDSRYLSYLPIGAFPISTGNITVYDENGTAYSNRYITGSTDICLIREIYTDGWCKVTYPSSAEASGNFTAYVPFSVFASSPSPTAWKSTGDYTSYRRSNLSEIMDSDSTAHTVVSGSACLVLNSTSELKQVIYPVSGSAYHLMGWIQDVDVRFSHWLSYEKMGDSITAAKLGDWVYLCYRLYDRISGKNLNEIKSYNYSVKETIYKPDGSIAHTYTYTDSDNNWIGARCSVPGTYTYTVELTGDWSGTYTKTFTVAENPPKISASTSTVNLILGGMESQTIDIAKSGYHGSTYQFSVARSNSNVTCTWGSMDNGTAPVTITAAKAGTTVLTFTLKDKATGEILDTCTVNVNVSSKQYAINYDANGGSGAPGSQTKYHNTALTLSTTKPTRVGYTFLGWSTSSTATSASYQLGGSFTSNANTTLYAVWKLGCEGGAHSYSFSVTKTPTTSATGTLTGQCSKCGSTTTVTLPKLSTTDYSYKATKAATCTAAGTGRYTWKTTTYGSFYFDVSIVKLGHSYTAKVTVPTCTAQGYTTHTCSRCADAYVDTYVEELGHSYVNGSCTVCGAADPDYVKLFDLAGTNLELSNDITMYFYVNAADVADGCYMEIVKTNADGSKVTKQVNKADWNAYGTTMYYVGFNGIAAKEMADEIAVTVYNAKGTQLSNTVVTSISAYALRALGNAAYADMHTMMADLLNYGAAAQTFFGYNTGNLANASMTATQKGYATKGFDMGKYTNDVVVGAGVKGANLSLETNILQNFYFDPAVVDSTMTAWVSYTNYKGVQKRAVITGDKFTTLSGFICVKVGILVPADVMRMVSIEIVDASGNVVATVSDSIASYAVRAYGNAQKDTEKALYVELMEYCLSCEAYFG